MRVVQKKTDIGLFNTYTSHTYLLVQKNQFFLTKTLNFDFFRNPASMVAQIKHHTSKILCILKLLFEINHRLYE